MIKQHSRMANQTNLSCASLVDMADDTADDTAVLVENESGTGKKFYLRRRLTILLILLLVIGIIAGIVTFLIIKHLASSNAGVVAPPTCTPSPPSANICNTSTCYDISQDISSQLDKSVDPCDDFYSYTCGGFFKSHQLGVKKSKETAFTILNNENMKVLRDTLQYSAYNYSQSLSINKTVKIYSSCMNKTAIDNRGIAPLVNLIEQYGGWTVTGNGTNSWTVEEKMGRILGDLNVRTLLSASVGTDLEDSSQHILNLHPSALGMSPSYYTTYTSESSKIRKAYKTYMKTIARLLGGGYDAEQRMMRIYDFEEGLADATSGNSYSDDLFESLRQYQRSGRSLDSLDKTLYDFASESFFNINFVLRFLKTAFPDQIYIGALTKVYYGSPKVFEVIALKYFETDEDVLKDYMMWHVVSKYVSSMPDEFVQAKLKFAEAVAGVQEYERWSSCIEEMMTPMDMSLGRLFVDAHFDETTKTTVADMTTRLRKAFINNLDSEDWMDDNTKDAAREKANAIKEDVGYPPYIEDNSKLDAHYSMLTVGDGFFENTLAMNKMLIQRNLGMLHRPVNKDLWGMSPAQINGYYNPQQNRIVFLAGILQSPFYKKNYPKYLNYGSLAMVIGHEITHGFDSKGRLFDKNGNVKDWWSYDSSWNFEYRTQCLVDQYNSYKVFGENINGKQTLNENIADNGGIKLAYDAYQSWVKDNGKEEILPELGFTSDQLFFIGFALPWCSVYKKEAALRQLKVDVHSYNKYRVIGTLSNFKKFSDAFSCSSYSKMVPTDRCAVW